MKKEQQSTLPLHAAEVAFSVLVVLWYVLPLLVPAGQWFRPFDLARTLYGAPAARPGAAAIVTLMVWVVPVICLWKIAAFFLEKTLPLLAHPTWLVPVLLNLVSSGFIVALVCVDMIRLASSAAFFSSFPPFTYAVAAIALLYNGYFIVMLIGSMSRRDVAYQQYLEFRRVTEGGQRTVFSAVQRQGIQRKLIITFVPLILVIIVVLAFFLLRDFQRTILAAVTANGQGIVERAASVVKSTPDDTIGLEDYLRAEGKKNDSAAAGTGASFRYNAITVVVKDVAKGAKEGEFLQMSYTAGQSGNAIAEKKTTTIHAPFAATMTETDAAAGTISFLAPALLGKAAQMIGYVQVDYSRAVIYESYFRTQVKVIVIAALFMYISIFLTYLFGRSIVFPILFLRMSVAGIANILTDMIKGKLRPQADKLQYKDWITTRDEIKLLSGEVNHMTTVIRGVIPYISGSTLQAADKGKETSERRNLTLLFTDIRGFTSISETLSPEKVVEMLNHYLDLQATIIHDNNGEVDKFVGDEMMATFKGPKRDMDACKAAIEIRRAMAKEKELAKAQGRESVSIGIGINSGPVVFGSMGARDRKDFTSIGDTVNLAARLEGTNKEYGTKTLLTESVYDKVKDGFLCREIDLVTVKGKTQPVRIYELLQEAKGSSEKLERMKKVFEDSLALYRKQKWAAAEKGLAALAKDYDDDTSKIFLGRVTAFKENPPEKDWDGVFVRTSK
jgi:adenylate cyclase